MVAEQVGSRKSIFMCQRKKINRVGNDRKERDGRGGGGDGMWKGNWYLLKLLLCSKAIYYI